MKKKKIFFTHLAEADIPLGESILGLFPPGTVTSSDSSSLSLSRDLFSASRRDSAAAAAEDDEEEEEDFLWWCWEGDPGPAPVGLKRYKQ